MVTRIPRLLAFYESPRAVVTKSTANSKNCGKYLTLIKYIPYTARPSALRNDPDENRGEAAGQGRRPRLAASPHIRTGCDGGRGLTAPIVLTTTRRKSCRGSAI